MRNIDNFIYLGITNQTYEAEGTIDNFTQITSSNSDLQMLLDNILKTSQSEEILAAATDNVIEFMNKSFDGAYLIKDGGFASFTYVDFCLQTCMQHFHYKASKILPYGNFLVYSLANLYT